MKTPNATDKLYHTETGNLYPLAGVIVVEGKRRLVETLPDMGSDEPSYEVHAPKGEQFVGGEHSRLCWGMSEVKEYGSEPTEQD